MCVCMRVCTCSEVVVEVRIQFCLTAASHPGGWGGRWLRELKHCRTTVNGKQSAELLNVLFTHTRVANSFFNVHIKQSITKTQSASFITYRDKSDSIKTNSVTTERQQQVGMKCCVTSICR